MLIIAAIATLISAITPIMLAVINWRQSQNDAAKAARLEEMHKESMSRTV